MNDHLSGNLGLGFLNTESTEVLGSKWIFETDSFFFNLNETFEDFLETQTRRSANCASASEFFMLLYQRIWLSRVG